LTLLKTEEPASPRPTIYAPSDRTRGTARRRRREQERAYFAPAPPRLRCPGLTTGHCAQVFRYWKRAKASRRSQGRVGKMANVPFVLAPLSPEPYRLFRLAPFQVPQLSLASCQSQTHPFRLFKVSPDWLRSLIRRQCHPPYPPIEKSEGFQA
jgi:hypothetical protein